jgi:hypothetical protein
MKGGVRATEAGVRTGAKKAAKAVGKGIGFFWNKIKKYVMYAFIFLIVIFMFYKIATNYLISKVTPQPQV